MAPNAKSNTKKKPTENNGIKKPTTRGDNKAGQAQKAVDNVLKTYEKGDPERRAALEEQVGKSKPEDPTAMEGVSQDDGGDPNEAADEDVHQNDGADPEKTADGEPHLQKEGSLFLDQKTTPDTAQPEDEPELGLVSGFVGNQSQETRERVLVDVFKGRNGKWFGTYQKGPKHSASYDWEKLMDGDQQLAALEAAERYLPSLIRAHDEVAWKGNIARIIGLTVEGNRTPEDWKKDKYGKLKAPWMRVLVRWGNPKEGPESWEWRGDAKQYMSAHLPSRSTWFAKKPLTYNGKTLLAEGDPLHPADRDIFTAAVLYQQQYDKWVAGKRPYEDDRERTAAPVTSKDEKPQIKAEPEEEV